jgi:hypothetical protein
MVKLLYLNIYANTLALRQAEARLGGGCDEKEDQAINKVY